MLGIGQAVFFLSNTSGLPLLDFSDKVCFHMRRRFRKGAKIDSKGQELFIVVNQQLKYDECVVGGRLSIM